MRLLLAARLSRLSDGQTGIETQDEDAREWAEHNGHTIVAVAKDTKSGTAAMWERPNLKPWVTDPAHMATYDGIVAAKQDRLSRADWRDEAELRIWAENNHKTLFIVDRNLQWPPVDKDGRERWNYGAEQARREWEETSSRYRRMQKSLRTQGFLVGRAHYGHRAKGVKCGESPCMCKSDRKIPVLDSDTAPIVREMAERYISGQSSRVIRDWLNATGVPVALKSKRGKSQGWREHKVLEILHNPSIIGHYQHEGVTYLYAEPIISAEDFNTIQEMAAARRKAPGIVRKETALLTSIINCDRGNHMYRVKTGPRRRCPDGIWYYCDEKLCPKGSRLLVPLAEMDSIVGEAVSSMTDIEHMVTTIIPGDTYGEEIMQLKKEQAQLDPNENPEHFKRWLAIRDEILDLRARPRKAPTITTKSDGKSVAEVWDSLSPAGKRQWLLARRPSGWLPDESTDDDESIDHIGAKVQVFGRDPDTDTLIVDIDLGEFTEAMASLQALITDTGKDESNGH